MVNVQKTVPAPSTRRPATNPPKSICTSVNHQVCHGVPGRAQTGDIVNIDITVIGTATGDTSRSSTWEPNIRRGAWWKSPTNA